ncbi:hypothetical protein D9611_013477 [Ephemerocybe angulata]|uniref:Uncharacterized protein n=1 Tax=Ephemerocybe angulata TaxID=980116 RepID=A0A8H5BSX1_9AGAR|nr:hypothetical protein D9611_013477 [Tulosesus angulatus]
MSMNSLPTANRNSSHDAMGSFSEPSPLINRGSMLPPTGIPEGVAAGGVPQQPQQSNPPGAPQGGNFPPMVNGRPPSMTTTPQIQPMMSQSPSMGSRLGTANRYASRARAIMWFRTSFKAKADAGIPGDKDVSAFTMNDKLAQQQQQLAPAATTSADGAGKRKGTSPREEHD